jgi:cell division protein FtsX
MRLRPYFGDTYAGIITIGLTGAVICGLISAAMFLFRSFCEPILRIALTAFVDAVAHSYFRYDPSQYYLWAGYVGFLGVFILAIAAVTMIRKPAQDRIIDDALRRQTTDFANGAPLEPKH